MCVQKGAALPEGPSVILAPHSRETLKSHVLWPGRSMRPLFLPIPSLIAYRCHSLHSFFHSSLKPGTLFNCFPVRTTRTYALPVSKGTKPTIQSFQLAISQVPHRFLRCSPVFASFWTLSFPSLILSKTTRMLQQIGAEWETFVCSSWTFLVRKGLKVATQDCTVKVL